VTKKNRRRYDRSRLRYPSDLTDDERTHIEPLIPPAKRGGNKRRVDVREVMNGIMYRFEHGMPMAGGEPGSIRLRMMRARKSKARSATYS
jgi:Putative transposase of IS4/5 family (DUF4096)